MRLWIRLPVRHCRHWWPQWLLGRSRRCLSASPGRRHGVSTCSVPLAINKSQERKECTLWHTAPVSFILISSEEKGYTWSSPSVESYLWQCYIPFQRLSCLWLCLPCCRGVYLDEGRLSQQVLDDAVAEAQQSIGAVEERVRLRLRVGVRLRGMLRGGWEGGSGEVVVVVVGRLFGASIDVSLQERA